MLMTKYIKDWRNVRICPHTYCNYSACLTLKYEDRTTKTWHLFWQPQHLIHQWPQFVIHSNRKSCSHRNSQILLNHTILRLNNLYVLSISTYTLIRAPLTESVRLVEGKLNHPVERPMITRGCIEYNQLVALSIPAPELG